jgi:hypothetical protein
MIFPGDDSLLNTVNQKEVHEVVKQGGDNRNKKNFSKKENGEGSYNIWPFLNPEERTPSMENLFTDDQPKSETHTGKKNPFNKNQGYSIYEPFVNLYRNLL